MMCLRRARLARIAALAAMIAASVLSMPAAHARTASPDAWTQPDESDLTSHGHYVNRNGDEVHAPSRTRSGKAPPGASARCRDGSYSFSRHRPGTCSRHGGVAQWE